MDRFTQMLEKTLMPIAEKVEQNRYLSAIREGFTSIMPFLIIGSIFLLLSNLPSEALNNFLGSIFGAENIAKLGYLLEPTFNIMALLAIIGIAKSLLEYHHIKDTSALILPIITFLLLNNFTITLTTEAGETVTSGGVIPMGYLGAAGLFVAMICTILTVESYHWIKERGWVIKMPDSVPPAVSRSFSSLIPAAIILAVVFLIKVIFEYSPYATVFDLIYQCLQQPLSALGNSLPSQMISEGLIGLFWCFGVHGDNVVSAIMGPIWRGLSAENLALVQAGKEPINIICQQFRDVYLIAGGTGATLSLLVSIWFGAKSPELKTVAKLSGPAAIFNINEPVIFGIPIVLNPIMMIPFVIVPIVLCVTTYLAMSLGLVPLLQGIEIPWTTPVFISGWIAGGWNALILQIVNFAVATAIYFPFVKVLDRDLLKNAKKKELLQE